MIPVLFQDELAKLDRRIAGLDSREIQHALERIPLDVFGRIQIERPKQYTNLLSWLPEMPSKEEQILWTGSHGHELMTMSLAFIKTVVSSYNEISDTPLNQSTVLDFGCGWGRLARLLAKYVEPANLFCVDPWDRSIEICERTGVHAQLFISEFLPKALPTPNDRTFNFIFAFSVFTHLSERASKLCVETLRQYLKDDGLLVITIRPIEYWDFRLANEPEIATRQATRSFKRQHNDKGFAFFPHNREAIDGDVTYGDTSMTLSYISDNFHGFTIERVEVNEADLYQIIVFLKKS